MFSFLFFSVFVLLSFLSYFVVNYNSFVVDLFFPWGSFLELSISFCFDIVSVSFFSIVSFVSFVVFLYSMFYMGSDPFFYRFVFILFFFVVSMFFLVFSYSWVSLMLGWDGLGVVSFLLVIYYNDGVSLNSGLITIFTNRIGDCFFILSFSFFFYSGWCFIDSMSLGGTMFFFIILILGCFTKSAQFPFSSWLPAAMAAPTPVSSLVHSSTLVVAGVYVLYRFNYLFYSAMFFCSFVSLFTMLLAGACACFELDFKKVIAMSTLSQLGFMLYSLSLGMGAFCFVHMVFHAVFKSMLFLSTGSLMHLLSGNQDSRLFGSLSDSFFSKTFFNVSCFSLMGVPFFMGFYSKDHILSSIYFYDFSAFSFIFTLSCVFTVCYSFRLIYMNSFCFPSFSTSFSYTEEAFFFIPVSMIFLYCLFFSNFYVYFFFHVYVLSFFDLFLGIFVIFGGLLLFSFINSNYYLLYFFMKVGFLSSLSSSFVSFKMCYFNTIYEFTWGETFGGQGFNTLFSFMRFFFSNFYFLNLLSIPILLSYLFYCLY